MEIQRLRDKKRQLEFRLVLLEQQIAKCVRKTQKVRLDLALLILNNENPFKYTIVWQAANDVVADSPHFLEKYREISSLKCMNCDVTATTGVSQPVSQRSQVP